MLNTVFSVHIIGGLFLMMAVFGVSNTLAAPPNQCDAVLYAPLYNTELDVSRGSEKSYFRHATCSLSEDEFRNYSKTDDFEYSKYCSMDYDETMSEVDVDTAAEVFGIFGGKTDVNVKKFHKWKREQCSETAKRNIHTTDDFRRWKRQNCSDLTTNDHRDSYRYHAQKISNLDKRVEAWSQCMSNPNSVQDTTLRCWPSPQGDEQNLFFNVFWWNFQKEKAKIIRWNVLGGKVLENDTFPIEDLVANRQELSLGTTSFLISRDSEKSLTILLNVSHGDFGNSCSIYLPGITKKKPPTGPPTSESEPEDDIMNRISRACDNECSGYCSQAGSNSDECHDCNTTCEYELCQKIPACFLKADE